MFHVKHAAWLKEMIREEVTTLLTVESSKVVHLWHAVLSGFTKFMSQALKWDLRAGLRRRVVVTPWEPIVTTACYGERG